MKCTQDAIPAERERPPHAATSFLHNTGVPPSAELRRRGSDRCRRLLLDPRTAWARSAPSSPSPGQALSLWRDAIGLAVVDAETDEQLFDRLLVPLLDVPALRRLPAVAPLLPGPGGQAIASVSDDPLLVLAVLTRSYGRVFIRNRTPLATPEVLAQPITLILPEGWETDR